jgi:hypothetical protein
MSSRNHLITLAASALLWACADVTGPTTDIAEAPLVVADGTLHHLQWNAARGPAGPNVDRPLPRGPFLVGGVPAHTPSPLPIETFEATFTAVRGRHSYVEINYANCPNSSSGGDDGDDWGDDDGDDEDDDDENDGDGEGASTACPFLRLDIPWSALKNRPNGRAIGWRESVVITVSVNTSQILVNLEPSGLEFNPRNKATLTIWYGGANPDLNGDGVVDEEDERIEREQLNFWYQDEHGGPWHAMEAEHSTRNKRFKVKLPHFSGYAVSW